MKAREQYYTHEYFIHDLTPEHLAEILQSSAWSAAQQSITSAETNNDCCPEPNMKNIAAGENTCGVDAFVDLEFGADVKMILDVGGGKFDVCRDYMRSRGVELLVYDPYNRTQDHNKTIKCVVSKEKVAAATSMSVLNVIAEPEARLAHICTLKDALQINGKAYFKVWPGEGELKGSYKPTINSYGHPGYQANAYADRFLREVQLVFGVENAELHTSIPNLIVAKKISNEPTDKNEIEWIQHLSTSDEWYVQRQLTTRKHAMSLFHQQSVSHHFKESLMYIKLTFKRQEWNVPNSNNGYIDGLYVAPAIVKKLPDGERANCYSTARSQFLASTPDIISYYLDCGEATKTDIQNALKLFNGLYDVEAKGLPAALASSDPESNEIIANLKVALFNAIHPFAEWKQFQLVNSMSTTEDLINTLTC